MAKFFGEDPTLIRQFLSNLGYDQYAGLFEEARVGMPELSVLTEEQLRVLGIPQSPAWKISECFKYCSREEELIEQEIHPN
jgi:hypothetical protein